MPLSEEDLYRKEIDDAVKDVQQHIQSAKAHGSTPRLPDKEDLFGKIVKSAKRDPRITPKTHDAIKEHADKRYKELALEAGLRGDVTMEPHAIRGLQVHLAILVDGEGIYVETYADERHAVDRVDQFLSACGVDVTHAQIVEFMVGDNEDSEHPLEDTESFGTRVETCTIN